MGDLSLNSPPLSPTAKDNKDTLFGPSIGVVSTAPEWCAVDAALDEKLFKSEKKFELNEKLDDDNSEDDELTPEIVKEWVRRSKEVSSHLSLSFRCSAYAHFLTSHLNLQQHFRHSSTSNVHQSAFPP